MLDSEPIRTEGLKINFHWSSAIQGSGDWPGRPAGYYLDGACYFTANDAIQIGILGFCGSGDPDLSLRYIRDALESIDIARKSGFTVHPEKPYQSEGEKYTIWYLLDSLKLTEHGGAVPGWLTPLGEDVLHDLNILYPPTCPCPHTDCSCEESGCWQKSETGGIPCPRCPCGAKP